MLVVVSGMYRSGSTYCFNVARDAAQRRGRTATPPDASAEIMVAAQADFVINKTHSDKGGLADMIVSGGAVSICTVRPRPDEALQSLVHTFGFDLKMATKIMVDWFNFYGRIARASVILELNDIEADPIAAALKVGKSVAVDYSTVEAGDIARRFSKDEVRRLGQSIREGSVPSVDAGFSKYDQESYFHANHIPDRASRPHDPAVTDAARRAFARWIDADGLLRTGPFLEPHSS